MQEPYNPPFADVDMPETEVIVVAHPSPVFVDSTGRRSRLLRRIAYGFGALCIVYGGLISVSLAGGPVSSSAVLPLRDLADGDEHDDIVARPTPTPVPTSTPASRQPIVEVFPRRAAPVTHRTTGQAGTARLAPRPRRTPTTKPAKAPVTRPTTAKPVESGTTDPTPPVTTPPTTEPTTPATPAPPVPPMPPAPPSGGEGGGEGGGGAPDEDDPPAAPPAPEAPEAPPTIPAPADDPVDADPQPPATTPAKPVVEPAAEPVPEPSDGVA